jgi:hypothetical protein
MQKITDKGSFYCCSVGCYQLFIGYKPKKRHIFISFKYDLKLISRQYY